MMKMPIGHPNFDQHRLLATEKSIRKAHRRSPPRRSSFVNGRTVSAWELAGLVFVVATEDCLGGATGLRPVAFRQSNLVDFFLHALIFQVPLSQLPKEFDFVRLVVGPAHVKNVGLLPPGNDVPHEIPAPVKGVAAGEVVLGAAEDLDAQPVHAGVLLEQRHQRDLVAVRRQDQVALQQKAVEKVARSLVGAHVVKPRVGRVRGVKQSVIATVLSCGSGCDESRMFRDTWSVKQ